MPVGCFRHQFKKNKDLKLLQPQDGSLKLGVADGSAGTDIVTVHRKCDDDILGIIFSGGIDKANKPHITSLRAGGLASRCDGLQVGDYITGINGIRTERLKHEEIVTLIKNTGSIIQIEVTYSLPPRAPQSVYSVKCRKTTVSLSKDEESVGLVIRGGVHHTKSRSRPLTVTCVRQNAPAHRDGRIRVGDRIVAINGVTVITAALETAQRLIRESSTAIHLVIEYDIAVMETVQNAEGPLLVEIGRSVGSDLGITLRQGSSCGKPIIVISGIATASIAERCGALHVGDHMMSIDGVETVNMSHAEADHILTSGTAKVIQLEILPVGHLYPNRATLLLPERRASNPLSGGQSSECPMDASFYSVFSEDQIRHHTHMAGGQHAPPHSAPPTRRYNSTHSIGSISSTVGHSIMCHEEKMNVCLFANHMGLGLVLHSNTLPSEPLLTHPTVGLLTSGASAERCGLIQEGDRILSINNTDILGFSLTECRQLLDKTRGKCILDIAFDVADGALSVCGTFQVKLYKHGGSVGISLDEHVISGDQTAVQIVISGVKKGSAAYRSGAVSCGDRVISIDNINLTNVTIEDAKQILNNTGDVVKLKIRKNRDSNMNDSERLVFSVEIPKENNSLGLTISGKEQANQPIIISEVTPGGIAQRIGALRIGDRILSINGKSMRGQPVSYAIQQLQYSSDVVLLTVSRDKDCRGSQSVRVSSKIPEQHSGQSRDSALESWESHVSPSSNKVADREDDELQRDTEGTERADWSNMITELEKFGKMEISGILTDLSAPTSVSNRPSASSPHDNNATVPPPNISAEMSSSSPTILSVVIYKEEHENFGFGLSNALYTSDQGCYICAVGREGPAERAGLQKYDRLIQINEVDVQSFSCSDIVPLIEIAQCTLEMVVIRGTHEPALTHTGSIRSSQQSIDSLGYC